MRALVRMSFGAIGSNAHRVIMENRLVESFAASAGLNSTGRKLISKNMSEKYFPIESIPDETRIRNNIFPSILFPPNAVIRAGDLQLEIQSTNDKKDTITFKLAGVFLKPKDNDENGGDVVEDNTPKLVVPNRRIITP